MNTGEDATTRTTPKVSPLGNRVHPLGKVGKIRIEPVAEHMRLFEAGAVRLGLESRELNDTAISKAFENDPEALAAAMAFNNNELPVDEGASLHVFEAATGEEILRFDMFEDGPHYHYMHKGEKYHIYVTYDVAANGDMLEWAKQALSERLDLLLTNAGWAGLADQVDPELVSAALAGVEEMASGLTAPIAGRK